MKDIYRTVVAGAAGAVLATAVIAGAPAVAEQAVKIAPKNSVTSKSIKNGTIKTKDLAADVKGSLAKANSALQGIPDNSVTSPKIADAAVGAAELAPNSVNGSKVANRSLSLVDYSFANGFNSVAVPALAAGACANLSMDTDVVSLGGLLVVTPSFIAADGLMVEGAAFGTPIDIIEFRVCNRGLAFAGGSVTFNWALLS